MRQTVVRLGCAILAGVNLLWGGWAYLGPAHFFRTFPGFGHHWTAAYPPFNEHLVADLGATFLTVAFLLGVAAVTSEPRVVRLALGAVLVFSTLHLLFHLLRGGELSGVDLAASLASLVLGVLAPAGLLALTWTAPPRDRAVARDRAAG
jgi:hypothetical protein